VVGGGYADFSTAWKLETKLRRDEAEVVVVDPRPIPDVAGQASAQHPRRAFERGGEPEPAVTDSELIDAGPAGVTARELVPTEHVRSA
jgi:hypothetical protein